MKSTALLLLVDVVVVSATNFDLKEGMSTLPELICEAPGFYIYDCERVFALCDERGNAKFIACDEPNHIYNWWSHECQDVRMVRYCNGVDDILVTKTWRRTLPDGVSSFKETFVPKKEDFRSNRHSKTPPVDDDLPDFTFGCTDRSDGIYQMMPGACRSRFWVCSLGKRHEYACPRGLFFDPRMQHCNFRQRIAGCGGELPTTTPKADDFFDFD